MEGWRGVPVDGGRSVRDEDDDVPDVESVAVLGGEDVLSHELESVGRGRPGTLVIRQVLDRLGL